jgi:hypothetical protein
MRRANDAVDATRAAAGVDPGDDDAGELYELESLGESAAETFEDSEDRVRTTSGEVLRVILDDGLRAHLRPKDRVRARIELTGHASVFCCYPPESEALATR